MPRFSVRQPFGLSLSKSRPAQALRFDGLNANGMWGRAFAAFSARAVCVFALTGLLGLSGLAWAGPGAHGPGGEHLDGPVTAAAASATPRLEAHTELFELVGHLYDSELSLLIDRYPTNEPLLEAQVEVESGGLKAVARFHADHGDYAVDDERLLALLRQPGEHALVFTVVKGQESDLLDGTLMHAGTTTSPDEHGGGGAFALWGLLLLLPLGLAAMWWWRRRRAAMIPGLGEHA